MKRTAGRWLAAALLAGAAVFLHLRELLGERPYWRDSSQVWVPLKHFLWEQLHAGVVPEWWPWGSGGMPFLAMPYATAYHPTTLLYALLPFWPAFALQDLAATATTLAGTYLLARELRQPRTAATVAALVFAANGWSLGLTEQTFMKLAASAMPVYAWALLVADRRRGPWLLLAPVAGGLLLVAGEPQIGLLAAGAGAALVLARRPSWPALALATGAPLAGVALAAVQLLPAMLLLPETTRAIADPTANRWILGPIQAAGALFAIDQRDGFLRSTYLGPVALLLAAAGLVALRRSRMVAALGVLLLVGVWLALGDEFGLNTVARAVVPLWAKFRYPVKALLLAYFALALLAGEGFRQLGGRRRGRAMLLGLGAMVVACAAALGTLGGLPPASELLTLAVSCGAALAWTACRATRWAAVAVVSSVLLSFGQSGLLLAPSGFYDAPPLATRLRALGVGLDGPAFDRHDPMPHPGVDGDWVTVRSGGGSGTATGALWGLPTLSGSTLSGASLRSSRTIRGQDGMHREEAPRLYGLLGVGYLELREPVEPALRPYVIDRDPVLDLSLVRLPRSLARAYAVRRAVASPGPDDARRRLLSPEFLPGREILIEAESVPAEWSAREDQKAVPGIIAARGDASVTVDATLPWPGFVVLNEAWFPGWTATVDGAPVTVMVANGAMRAVEAAPGTHRVVFRYRTPGLRAGAIISGVAAAGLFGAWLVLFRRRRAAPGQPRRPAA